LGHRERLRLELRGDPNWKEYDKQGRLELFYDEQAQSFRAFQPVTISEDHSRLAQPLASEEAALDIGANNLVACTTTTGQQLLYEGRDLFERFRETTREIARLNHSWKTVDTAVTASDACTTGVPSGVITLKTHSPVTSSNACTTRVFRQCTLER